MQKAIFISQKTIFRKFFNLLFFVFSVCCGFFLFSQHYTQAQTRDLLDKVYDIPMDYGYASEADAEDMLDTKISIWWSSKLKESVIVKTSRFMLRVSVVFAIAMVLYSGIKIALSVWDEWKFKEALKHLLFVLLWVFLALMSVAIVYIIISITRTNLDVI